MTEHINEQNYFEKLLRLTVANASKIPFYSQRWPANVEEIVNTPEDLKLLPIITKQELQTHLRDGFPQAEDVVAIHHTYGTTGELFYRYRTQEEGRFFNTFLQEEKKIKQKKSTSKPGLKPIFLMEGDAYHGTGLPVSPEGLALHVAPDRYGAEHALDILKKEFNIPGYSAKVNIIKGTAAFILQTTLQLMDEGIEPKSIGVSSLHTVGGFLSSKTRKFLETSWGAPLIDYFSLSEILGTAPSCQICKKYRFKPTVIVEFLDPFSREPVKEGLAALVLTELFPYISHHPFIRYWSDDLVWVAPGNCPCGDITFSPKGRLKSAVKDPASPEGKILLTSSEILEAAEETPEVVFNEKDEWKWVSQRLGLVIRSSPRISLNLDNTPPKKKNLMMKFECSFSPHFYFDEAKEAENKLKMRLLEKSPCLRDAIASKNYQLTVQAVPFIENPTPIYL